MRNKFIDTLIKEAESNDKIVLIIGDLGYNVVEPFRINFQTDFLMLEFVNKIWLQWLQD